MTGQCLPLQVNRIKIPKQLDELVEMQSESANPVLKVLSKIKAELRGVSPWFFCFKRVLFFVFLHFTETAVTACFISTDLADVHEMLQLPSEGQHSQAGCSLVHTLLWV